MPADTAALTRQVGGLDAPERAQVSKTLVVVLALGLTACSTSSPTLAPKPSVLAKTHPCYSEYRGWARLVGQHLDVAIATVIDGRPDHGTACAAAGFERIVEVVLDRPFVGTTATDLSDGQLLDLAR